MEFDIEKQFLKYMNVMDIPITAFNVLHTQDLRRSFVSGATAFYRFMQQAVEIVPAKEGSAFQKELDKTFAEFFEKDFQSKIRNTKS